MDHCLSSEQYLELYYFMKLNRELEETMVNLFRQNKIFGGLYPSFGQEATSVGTAYALGPGDWIAPMIRNIGALLARGVPPRDIFTQHMGRVTSPTRGKEKTSNFGDLKIRHIVSPTSMLGDLVPVMAGVAMASRYLGHNAVTMTWVGDGATSTGAFHEGLNFAAVNQAPFVLVVENNQWAYSTPVTKQARIRNFADRARGYGIPAVIVDGNDVIAVHTAAKQAVQRARSGGGPVLIEAKTMRMKGHAQHDSADYVPKEMFEYWKARDPIARYEKYLTENHIWTEKEHDDIDARIRRLLDVDREFAENSPFPSPEIAEQGVYCDGCHTLEPEWRRPREEVMPPKSSVSTAYQISDFGGSEVPVEWVEPYPDAVKRRADSAGQKLEKDVIRTKRAASRKPSI